MIKINRVGIFAVVALVILVVLIVSVNAAWPSNLNNNLTAYYNLNNNINDVYLGINNLTAGTDGAYATGLIGNARQYALDDNQGDSVTTQEFMTGTTDFTLNFWIKTTATTHSVIKNYAGSWSSTNGWGILLQSGHTDFINPQNGDNVHANTVNDGNWNMVTFVKNSTGIHVYNNQVYIRSGTWSASMNTPSSVFTVGNFPVTAPNGNMTLDEISFWNRSLSASEISSLWNSGAGITFSGAVSLATINNSIPPNGSIIDSHSVLFGCNATAANGANINQTLLNVTGQLSWTQLNISLSPTTTYNATFLNTSLVDGNYNWSCITYGSDGNNETSKQWSFKIDTIAPMINITYPLNGYYNSANTYTGTLNYTLIESNPDSCWYIINGPNGLNITQTPENVYISCGQNKTGILASQGNNTITLYANDTLGHVTNTSVSFFLDYNPPLINLIGPNANGLTVNLTYTLNETTIGLCYQEFANVSTVCGGLSTGTYDSYKREVIDGNWNTEYTGGFGQQLVLSVNYTKPLNSLNTSIWKIKHDIGISYLDISKYWNANVNYISMRLYYDQTEGTWVATIWNGTDYEDLSSGYGGGTYEEAMYWNVSDYIDYNSGLKNSTVYIALPSTNCISGGILEGGYCIHTFLSNGTFDATGLNVEVLVVAGGGGGGGGSGTGGGGGAGGLIYNPSYYANGIINVVVGQGGDAGAYTFDGNNGQNSSFGSLIAVGGGGGGGEGASSPGKKGGSGGGGAVGGTAGGLGIVGQGHNGGGGGSWSGNYPASGGGGAGAVGGSPGGNAGIGGDGLNYSINGSNIYYAGGGGGGQYAGATGGAGGLGGGGHGGGSGDAGVTSGEPNTGGGGGGPGGNTVPGGNGGSGIVIVRYPLGGGSVIIANQTTIFSPNTFSVLLGIPFTLINGFYTWFVESYDNAGNYIQSSSQNFYIDDIYPLFSNVQDDSNNLTNSGIGHFNVTMDNTNGTVILHINSQNILATNLIGNIYNASYNFINNGTYPYYWSAYGNGSNTNLNVSSNYSYVVGTITINLLNPTNDSAPLILRSKNYTISLNASISGNVNSNWTVTFYNATNSSNITPIETLYNVPINTNIGTGLYNLTLGKLYKWFVTIDNGITNLTSDTYQFTPNNEPHLLDLRIENISLTSIQVFWTNEPDMSWVAFRIGNDITEVRSITSTADNWTVTGLFPNQQYVLEYQTGDIYHAISDYHGFDFRTLGWKPGWADYPYRRLITYNGTLTGSDENNFAVNVSLNETNFEYFDGVNYVYYPSFLHLNYTNFNNIRFVDYYDIVELPYNVTYYNVPGTGGLSYQIIPNSYSATGTIVDVANAHDGDFGTDAVPNPFGTFIYNYTIPVGAKTTSMFRISDSGWGWDIQIPTDCYGPAGSDIAFMSEANRTGIGAGYVITYCQNRTDNTWALVRDNAGAGPYFFETMMTWQYEARANIEVIPRYFDDEVQNNVPGISGSYNVQFWMYYGDPDAPSNATALNNTGLDNSPLTYGPEVGQNLLDPIIFYLNDTVGRTATGTNISWSVNQIVNNRLRIATNPYLLDSYFFSYLTNTTQIETGLIGNTQHVILTLTSPSEFINITNVVSSNSSYNSNYTVNASANPVTITIPNLNTEEFLNWNFTYEENKTWERQKANVVWPLTNFQTNIQYWYQAIAYGSNGNGTAEGNFILGTLPSTPIITILNYSEYRPTKTVTVCTNLSDMNGNSEVNVSIQYWNQSDTTFKETSHTSMVAPGIVCKNIAIEFGEYNNYRGKAVGSSIGYSNNYSNLVMPIQPFFAGNTVQDGNDAPMSRQYCPPNPDGTADINGTCYEQIGYREGSLQASTEMYVETNVTTDPLTLHLFYLNGTSVSNVGLTSSIYGFQYTTLTGLGQNWYTFYMTNSTSDVVLNWTKPGLTHLRNESRRDVSKYVSFNGVASPFNYTLLYFNNPGVYNTSVYQWCQAQPGGNLFDCMSAQYWGTFGNALSGTAYDRGQFFRGGVTNGEEKDSGLLNYLKNASAPLGDYRICFAFNVYYLDESIIPSNNITNYRYVYWRENNHFSDFNGKIENSTFHESYLFNFEYDTLSQTRDWKAYNGTDAVNQTVVKTVNNTIFNSSYSQSLVVGEVRDFNVQFMNDNQYNFGLYLDGDWINEQIGKYQQAYIILNLPDNSTLQILDSDGDGLSDFDEIYTYHTNPKSNDTDGDGMLDGTEVAGSFDPLLYTSHAAPNITLIYPINNSYSNNATQNITFNISTGTGINNATLYFYSDSSKCYQEFANISTSCGGLDTGDYRDDSLGSLNNAWYDGNWSTANSINYPFFPGPNYDYTLYVNYTIPSINMSNNTLSFKWNSGGIDVYNNVSIDTNCLNKSTLSIKINSAITGVFPFTSHINIYCQNNTNDWISTGTVSAPMAGSQAISFYEEAMIWNIRIYNTTTTIFAPNTFSVLLGIPFTLIDGFYTWFVDAYDNLGSYAQSSINFFTIDTAVPIIDYTSNTSVDYANLSQSNIFIQVNVNTAYDYLNYTLINNTGITIVQMSSPNNNHNFTGLVDGNYSYYVLVSDLAGNVNVTSTRHITLDTTSPYANITGPIGGMNGTLGNNGYLNNGSYWNNFTNTNFTINITDNLGIKNASLYVYNGSQLVINQTQTLIPGVINTLLGFPVTLIDGVYNFFFKVYDWAGNSFTTGNNTITVDVQIPNVTITYPLSQVIKIPYATNISTVVNINWTVTMNIMSDIDSCWYSINNGINTSINCSDNTTTNTFRFSNTPYNITVYAKSKSGLIGSQTVSPTFGYYILDIQDRTYNNFTWETQTQSYYLNISYDNNYNLTASFVYDGVYYPTIINSIGSDAFTNATIDVPAVMGNTSVNVTKQFYWVFNSTIINTTTLVSTSSTNMLNQTVGNILFNSCDNVYKEIAPTLSVYLNISFKDQLSLSRINQSIEQMLTNYYLGSGTTFESMSYNNISALQDYQFCFSVPNYPLTLNTLQIQYDNPYTTPVYFARDVYYTTKPLTNTTTNLILYNMLQNQGSYTSFYMTDLNNVPLANVKIVMDTIVEGNPFDLTQFTDSAGVGTFWINPNAFYTVTMTRTGCDSKVLSIRPTQASYGFQLNCQGNVTTPTGVNSSDNFPYTAPAAYIYDGVSFQKSPKTGIIQPGNYSFEYKVNSVVHPLTRILMILYSSNGNNSNSVIIRYIEQNISLSTNSTICGPFSCYVNTTLNMNMNTTRYLHGAYYADFGQGYLLLENDGQWYTIPINSTGLTLKAAIVDFSHVFDSYTDANGNIVSDDYKRAEFSKFVWIFLIMAILFAFFNKYSGYDSNNPGAFLIIMTVIVIMGSIAGGLTGNGFFYISNVVPEGYVVAGTYYGTQGQYMGHFINNYLVAIYMLIFLLGYWLSVSRRQT